MFLDDIVGPMSMKEAQETYKKVTKPVAQPRKLNPGWALDSTTKAELKRRKDLRQRKGIDESLNICKVCGQTPCNCTHIISENAWNDGTNDWTSEHDQWTKESVETIVPLTGVDEDGMIGPDSTSPIHGGMNEQRLSVGDPIIVTAPNAYKGKTGDIVEFSPSGKFVIVRLYNHGEHSMHLSDVEYNEYADQEDEVDEGWSDAVVSQRTGQPRTPYSVYIKGRKWRDFENDDHAEAVANKLRAKFKAEGRDPSVITIAATDYDKMAEATNRHFGPKGAGTELARQTRDAELDRKFNTPDQLKKDADYRAYRAGIKKAKVVAKKSQVKEFAPSNGDNSDNFDPELAAMAKKEGVVKGYSLVDGATVERALQIPSSQWGELYNGQYKQYFVKGFMDGRKAKLEQARKDGVELSLQKDGSLSRVQQGVAEGEISQQYTVAVDCGEDGTFTVKVHAGDKGEALRKAQKIVRNEYDTYPEGARIVGQGVAEASYINGHVEDPESLRWKQTSMSYEQAVAKFGKNNVKQDGKNRLGQKIVMVLVPLGEQAETDYSKRRAHEKQADLTNTPKKPRQPSNDYFAKRDKEKRDLERFGESANYWSKLQDEKNTKLNSLVNELKESIKK